MLKRIIVLFLICATVLCCTACGKKPYDIIEKDGKHYISFNTISQDETALADGANASTAAINLPDFTSIGQMKEKIENGDFNENELRAIEAKCKKNNGLLEICDVDSLCDVRMPEGVTLRNIRWWGNGYEFTLESQNTGDCYVDCGNAEEYSYSFQKYYGNSPYSKDLAYDFREEKSYDPEGTQIFYQTGAGDFKVVKYEIREENRILYVSEEYHLTSYSGTLETSTTVPYRIHMFTEENGAFVTVSIYEPTERPSVEWLSSFGVTPYEG